MFLAVSTSEGQSVYEVIKQDSEFPRNHFLSVPVYSWGYQVGLSDLLLTKIKYKMQLIQDIKY